MQQWLATSVVAIKVLGFVLANWAGWLIGRGWTLWQRLVKLNDLRDTLSVWSRAQVL